MTGRSLPYRAVSDSTAWPAVEAPGGGTTGGTVAIGGCVTGAGNPGIEAGPDGGARFIAGPEGGSGTDAGGTGGGLSANNWAATGLPVKTARIPAMANAKRRRPPRPDRPMLSLPIAMAHAFH